MKGNSSHTLYSIYKRYKSKYVTWAVAGRKHRAPVNSFELLYVDPTSIKLRQENSHAIQDYPFEVSEIKRGDWDKQVSPYRDTDIYRSYDKHFNEGIPWIRTKWAQRLMEEIEQGHEMGRGYCTTVDEFLDRCAEIDRLYERIDTGGYKSQREIMSDQSGDELGRRWARFCPNLHEVTVNIDREGRFIFQDGWRRFTIANVLDLDEIPVRVNLRHYYWQTYRNNIAKRTGLEPDYQHPDLVNV